MIELAGGLQVAVSAWGNAGEPFILLHGLASTRRMFDLVGPLLAGNFRVFAPDQRGHGESDKPAEGYDFDTVCADLDGLVEALEITPPFRLAGHSWGAYTALHYAATRSGAVSRLFLIDGGLVPIGARFDGWTDAEQKMAPPEYSGMTKDQLEAMICDRWLGPAYRPELMTLVLSIFDVSDPANVHARLPRAQHMQIAHALWAYQPSDDLPRLACPTDALIAVETRADADSLVVESAGRATALYPGLRLHWMEHTIHDMPWQKPEEVAAILRS